jgi:SAM-dependent methyltransferase
MTLPPQKIKSSVRELYARLAAAGTTNLSNAPISCGKDLAQSLGYDTVSLPLSAECWDLFAGCGNPLEDVSLQPNWSVLDLGCGVGIDSQVASLSLQPPGKVIGLDITSELLERARAFTDAGTFPPCHWVAGDGESLPLPKESVHLVVANGSFNLMPDKKQVLAEAYRVLRPGGQLAIADLIRTGEIDPIDGDTENAWAWCVAGSLSPSAYDTLLRTVGFSWWEIKIKWPSEPLAGAHVLARKGFA